MKFVVCLLVLCFVSVANAASPWGYCSGTGAGHLAVSSVSLNPDPPVRGTDDTVSLVGTLDQTVTDGDIHLTITFAGIPVYDAHYDICKQAGITCPLTSKDITAGIVVPGTSIPSISPGGQYIGKATITGNGGQTFACVQVTFTLPPPGLNTIQLPPKEAAELMALFNGVDF